MAPAGGDYAISVKMYSIFWLFSRVQLHQHASAAELCAELGAPARSSLFSDIPIPGQVNACTHMLTGTPQQHGPADLVAGGT